MAAQLIDALAEDRQEWLESLDYIRREYGEDGVRAMLRALQDHALARGVVLGEATLNTPYINTIAPSDQPAYPGDLELEKRLENIMRWNAMAMVLQAQDAGCGVGGYIATWTQFGRPSGIYIDENDVMYVTDSESNLSRNPGWKRGIRIGSARDGFVTGFIPDPETDQDNSLTSGAEGVAVDKSGAIYAAEVGPKGIKKYVKR
jgi:hypothetical protein